jgi:hypothetical protein
MSGSYIDASAESRAATVAAAAAAVSMALTQVASGQATAEAFISQHGAAVNDGHATVGYLPPIITTGE